MDATTPEPLAPEPLPPRIELFCHAAARGETLTASARLAGYAPASARQRGSELWARDDVQTRTGFLIAEAERVALARIDRLRRRHDDLYQRCLDDRQHGVAARVLAMQCRFEAAIAHPRHRRRAERDRLSEELRQELRQELREELIAELREDIRAELVAEALAGQSGTFHDAAPEISPPVQSGTFHDIGRETPPPVQSGPFHDSAPEPSPPVRSGTHPVRFDEMVPSWQPGQPMTPEQHRAMMAELDELEHSLMREQGVTSIEDLYARRE